MMFYLKKIVSVKNVKNVWAAVSTPSNKSPAAGRKARNREETKNNEWEDEI